MNQMVSNKVLPGSNKQLKDVSFLAFYIGLITVLIAFNTCEKPQRVIQLTTLEALPADISFTSATLKGEITDLGSAPINDHGILISENSLPMTGNAQKKSLGQLSSKGAFQVTADNLTANTTYYFRAFLSVNGEDIFADDIKQFKTKGYDLATVATTSVSSVTSSYASSGGNVTADGGKVVTTRGVCWNTSTGPTIANSKTTDGSGTGSFISSLTGIAANTIYYVRAYATNSVGTAYGNEISFTTNPLLPTLTTTAIGSITQTTASSGGNISNDGGATITARGVCWNISTGPTIANSKTSDGIGSGSFASSLTGLIANTTYHVRAYATNSAGTAYGNEIGFTTSSAMVPTLSTTAVTLITSTTASSGGNISNDGGAGVTVRGVCWNTASGPTTSNSKTLDGPGSGNFVSSMTGLTGNMVYYVRAYATNSVGTAYGNEISFTTNPLLPTLTTTAIGSITQTTASSGGNISNDGGASVTAHGVCWNTSSGPTTANSKTSDGSGSGSFSSSLLGLTPNTTYHLRAYATNSVGIAYGNEITFTTLPPSIPTLSTTAITLITTTTATSGGNISSDGGASVTSRGVCWSTNANPTIADAKTSTGIGSGLFISYLTGLIPGTNYHVRAYATNSVGTAYGEDMTFTTVPPTVTDIDGNVYDAITIGGQIWMKENLKTTRFIDGTVITLANDATAWGNLSTTPAYCYYNYDAATYKDIYGPLYNWSTVTTGKLCPNGWHVPTDPEFSQLVSYMGGSSVAGGKLKEIGTANWKSPNTGATNESGFSALPGSMNPNLLNIGEYGLWWTATVSYCWRLDYNTTTADRCTDSNTNGLSVRCLRDE